MISGTYTLICIVSVVVNALTYYYYYYYRVIAPLDAGRGETTVVTKEEVGDAEVGVSIAT